MERGSKVRGVWCSGVNCERNGSRLVFAQIEELLDGLPILFEEASCLHRCSYGPNLDLYRGKKLIDELNGISNDPIDGNLTPQGVVDEIKILSTRKVSKFRSLFS